MQLATTTSKLPLARILALVALLCAGAMQVQEASHGHWHELDDSYAQCLVCKSSTGAVLPFAIPQLAVPAKSAAPVFGGQQLAAAGERTPFLARGPPHYS